LNDNCIVDVEVVCLECIYISMFGVCTKLMENDVVVVKLWMISWLNVVVVVMECVVDELMHWVFIMLEQNEFNITLKNFDDNKVLKNCQLDMLIFVQVYRTIDKFF